MKVDRTARGSIFQFRLATAVNSCLAAAVFATALAFCSALAAEFARNSHVYTLAPGDRIAVTVFSQPDLSGDVVIDDAGRIALPFLEPLEVQNLTVVECEKLIRDRLADGILRQPAVSVRIIELRPLYVLGDVRTPGVYPFRYGVTVQSAVAMAGGFGPAELVPGAAVSEFLLAEERVRQLTFQKQALLVRQARLEAQRSGLKAFAPPDSLSGAEGSDIASFIANEKDIFDAQVAILQDQIEALNSQKPRIREQIEALNGQVVTAKNQLEVVKKHADQYTRLVKQGLGLANTELQMKLTEASHESELWRLAAQISQLQKDDGDLDIRIQDAEATFKRQVAIELKEVRDRLNELEITLPAARQLRDVKVQYAGGLIKIGAKRSISVTRVRNGQEASMDAAETTRLEPGDIIDVKRLLPWQAASEPLPDASGSRERHQSNATLTGNGNLLGSISR